MAASLFRVLLYVWVPITAVFIALTIWKVLVGLKEEDVVILDPAEASQAAEQQQVIAKVQRLNSWMKVFGLASLVLFLAGGGVWLYQGLSTLMP
jgi:hypothetical protein